MSRGPGRRQQEILDALAEYGADGSGVWITSAGETLAEQVAYRRAAYSLEAVGKIAIGSRYDDAGRPRLVAFLPGMGRPDRAVTGQDGKRYRMPHGVAID